MIPYSISKRILTIGVDYHDPKGGMAQVLYSYAHNVLNPFRFVRTTFIGNKVGKLFCLLWAIISFSEKCWFGGIKIVHIHSASYVSFWRKRIFIFLAKLYGKKVVFHVHGGKFKDFTAGNRQAVLQSLQKTDVVIALSDYWKEFFEKEVPVNPLKAEYLIPTFIGELLSEGKMSVKVLRTNDTWYGMTYKEDVAAVKESFSKMLEDGTYKGDLFSDL